MIANESVAGSGFVRVRRILSLVDGIEGDAIWWAGGRIKAVGAAVEVEAEVPPDVPRYEFPEAILTPGFTDGHTHFGAWALNRRRVHLGGARSRAEAVRLVAQARPVQGWVLGQGWNANDWEAPPHRGVLDEVQSGPVFLDSHDLHAAWLNTAALRAAGITRETPDPFGGRIVRDAAGEPTGVLHERAVELALPALPAPPDELLLEAIREAQAEAHRLGLTGIHNVEGEPVLRTFERLEASGELSLRVLFHPPVASLPSLIARGLRSGAGSDRLRIGGIKLFLDGSLGTQTAWMLEPYEGSRDRGLPLSTVEQAREAMWTAARAGIASTVHAIGDAAVRRALDLMDGLPRPAIPHRIEHFQCVHPADLARAARLGIPVSMQPAHLLTDIPLVDRHWGDRGRGAYAFRSIVRAGLPLVFGSDVPVASLDPREGVYAALERRGADGGPGGGWRPEERVDFETAVRAYTVGAAIAAGTAERRGYLAPGMDADLVVWDVDADAVAAGDGGAFRAARARLTVVGGRVVMQA